jgi:hypothetical protein
MAAEGNPGQALLAHNQIEMAHRRVVTGGEEELGWRGKQHGNAATIA